MQNIGRAFTYPFEDPRWLVKIGIGALFVLLFPILIGVPFVVGYALDVIRNVARGDERPLPEWENLGGFFSQGLVLAIVYIAYFIPQLALSWLGRASGGAAFSCLSTLYGLVLMFILPAVTLRVAATRDIGAAFQVQEILNFIQRNLNSYIIVFLLTIVSAVISGIGILACGVGVLFTVFYSQLINGYLLGALQRAASGEDAMATQY